MNLTTMNDPIDLVGSSESLDKTTVDYKIFREILGSVLSKETDYKKKYKDNNSKIKDPVLNKLMIEIAKNYNLNED